MNPWQKRAQEKYPDGALFTTGRRWQPISEGTTINSALDLPTILQRLAYEERECPDCDHKDVGLEGAGCVRCNGRATIPEPFDRSYMRARAFAVELGIEP